jgi:hypothetical protein
VGFDKVAALLESAQQTLCKFGRLVLLLQSRDPGSLLDNPELCVSDIMKRYFDIVLGVPHGQDSIRRQKAAQIQDGDLRVSGISVLGWDSRSRALTSLASRSAISARRCHSWAI